jgi:hypothetical protein
VSSTSSGTAGPQSGLLAPSCLLGVFSLSVRRRGSTQLLPRGRRTPHPLPSPHYGSRASQYIHTVTIGPHGILAAAARTVTIGPHGILAAVGSLQMSELVS